MAEQRSKSSSNGHRRSGLSAVEAAARVRRDFPVLFGRPLESVLGIQRGEEDGWMVTVQVVELERIPRSTDILGAYQVELDSDGELVGYHRQRRYHRSQADED
jgi:hypothetical protein